MEGSVTANSHATDNIESFSGDPQKMPNTVFINQEDGKFTDGLVFAPPRAHRGAAVADFDGDGKLDIVVTVLGDKPEFWRNTSPGADHWIEVRLIGTSSNRDAIGAIVRTGNQWNQMTTSAGYASSSLAPVHFGLGRQSVIPELT